MKTYPGAPSAPAASPALFARSRMVALGRPDRIGSSPAVPEPGPPARPSSWPATPAGPEVWCSQEEQQGRIGIQVRFSRLLPAASRFRRTTFLAESSPAPAAAENRTPVMPAYVQPRAAAVPALQAHRAPPPALAPQGPAPRRLRPPRAKAPERSRDRAPDLLARPAAEWPTAAAVPIPASPAQNFFRAERGGFRSGSVPAPETLDRAAPASFRTGEAAFIWTPQAAMPSLRAGQRALSGLKRGTRLGAVEERAGTDLRPAAAEGVPLAGWAGIPLAPQLAQRTAPVVAGGWKPRSAAGPGSAPSRFLSSAVEPNPARWRSREKGHPEIRVLRGGLRPVVSGLRRRPFLECKPARETAADWSSRVDRHPVRLKLPHLVCRFPRPERAAGIGRGGGGIPFFQPPGGL